MVKGVLCSTGALITRFNGRDPALLKKLLPYIEADGLEFMIYPSWDDKLGEVRRIMRGLIDSTGVKIPVVHADKRIGELLSLGSEENAAEADARFKLGCGIARELGAELMVLHLWGGPASDRHIENNIAKLGEYLSTAAGHGILLTVENVVCAKGSPLAHMERIMEEYPEAAFTVDTKMAEFHLELPRTIACEKLWQGRVRHLHVNDYSGGLKDFNDLRVRHIGDGHVDFEPFFRRVKESSYTGYATVESTSVNPDGSIDFEKLNRSLRTVRKNLME
jgi:sugar phosphate isomerase/epimerase